MSYIVQKAEQLSGQVVRQELHIDEQSLREQMCKAFRKLDIRKVIYALGGEHVAQQKWRLGHDEISVVTGEKWYSDTQRKEGDAIDLVMYAQDYDYTQAICYLSQQLGIHAAILATARHAQDISQRVPPPPFRPPEPDSRHWDQVRTYLTEQRRLPAEWLDDLHDRSMLYGDRRGAAVFLFTSDQGERTGAYLCGTLPGSTFSGLAAGTRRDSGRFRMTWERSGLPEDRRDARQVLILASSPIDALSILDIHRRSSSGRECGRVTVMSTDGMGALPDLAIRQTLGQGGIVRAATANDEAGERIWEMIQEKYPEPGIVRDRPVLKDWNDVLRDPERAERERAALQKGDSDE